MNVTTRFSEHLFGFVENVVWMTVGVTLLVGSKVRNGLFGYINARTFSGRDPVRSLEHEKYIVTRWEEYLVQYIGAGDVFRGKRVLELGPGPSLGTGFMIIDRGAKSYLAVDKNKMIVNSPEYYAVLTNNLSSKVAVEEIEKWKRMQPGRIAYCHDRDFSLVDLPSDQFDLIVSNAAFEHFDKPSSVVEQITRASRDGCVFIAAIDMRAHSRLVRNYDPNNIYRIPNILYSHLYTSGIPNRWRVPEYVKTLEDNGWKETRVFPLLILPEAKTRRIKHSIPRKYLIKDNMKLLSVMIIARR